MNLLAKLGLGLGMMVAAVAGRGFVPTNLGDRTVGVAVGDRDMAEARAKALSTIANFWSAYDHPTGAETNLALKVAISDAGKVEHFWLTAITDRNGQLSGKIDNKPEFVTNVTNGQRYAFSADQVSDWMFVRNGKIVGNETMRPLLKHMPTDEANRYRVMLESP